MREIEAAREAEEQAMREQQQQLAHERKMALLHERELELQLQFQRLEKERQQHQRELQEHHIKDADVLSSRAPPPPERTSSYDIYSKAGSASTPNLPNNNMAAYDASQFPSRSSSSSALRQPEPPLVSKK